MNPGTPGFTNRQKFRLLRIGRVSLLVLAGWGCGLL
jgi:hypothetical protein